MCSVKFRNGNLKTCLVYWSSAETCSGRIWLNDEEVAYDRNEGDKNCRVSGVQCHVRSNEKRSLGVSS